MTELRWRRVLLGVFVASVSRGAGAQPLEEADAHFKRGMQEVRAKNYATAVEEFEAAERIKPHPVTLYNLAQAYVKLDRAVDAVRTLREYVKVDGIAPARRAGAERQLAELARRVAVLDVKGKPDGARLFLDGREIGATPLVGVVIEPGNHALELRHDGYEPSRTTARLDAGSNVELALELESTISHAKMGLGTLRLECGVPGTMVEVDGRREPDRSAVVMLEPGAHRVVFTRQGYVPFEQEVAVVPGKVSASRCALRADPASMERLGATLELTLEHSDMALVIDGERHPRVTQLPYGDHAVSISKGQKIVWSGSVHLAPGEHRVLQPPLASKDVARERHVPVAGYAVLGAGVATTVATVVFAIANHNRKEEWQTEQDAIESEWQNGGAGDPALVARLNENAELYKRGQTWDRVTIGTAVASAALLTVGTGMVFGWFEPATD